MPSLRGTGLSAKLPRRDLGPLFALATKRVRLAVATSLGHVCKSGPNAGTADLIERPVLFSVQNIMGSLVRAVYKPRGFFFSQVPTFDGGHEGAV